MTPEERLAELGITLPEPPPAAAPAAHVESAFDIAVHGDKGAVTFDLKRRLVLHRGGVAEDQPFTVGGSPFANGVERLVAGVVDSMVAGQTKVAFAATIEDGVRCMQELDAALKSSESGGTTVLTETGRA